MRIPLISSLSKKLYRRKGGGGRGGGSSGGGSSGGGSSGGGSSGGGSRGGGSAGSGARTPVPIGSGSNTGGRNSATSYGNGGGKPSMIPSGQPFAGRLQGGGTRNQVFGSRTYGSGYPGMIGQRGVGGLGFPFFFWPVVWGPAAFGGAAYLHSNEYGNATNSSRPGGILTTAPFTSSSSNTTFRIVADNATTTSLIEAVISNCTSFLSTNTTSANLTAQPFDPSQPGTPQPEQVVQYYRASSVALTLDGYNDTAALSDNTNTTDTPLPSGIDTNLLDCMNQTIGAAVPLIDGALPLLGSPIHRMGTVGAVWLLWYFLMLL